MKSSDLIWLTSFVFQVVLWSIGCCEKLEHLYYSPPSGSSRKASLYERPVNTRTLGREYAYECLTNEEDGQFDIRYMSFDPVTHQVLLQLKSGDGLTMYRGPLCSLCRPQSMDVVFDHAELSHDIGPVAIYNSTIYFVWQRRQRTGDTTRKTTLELRFFLDSCRRHFPVTSTNIFYVTRCSELIGVLADETYERRATIFPTSSLTVVPTARGLVFFTQLRIAGYTANDRLASNHMVLAEISRDGQKRFLHSESTSTAYLQYMLHHIGQVAYRDGRLCWSALDRIICADWNPDGLANVRTVLAPGKTAGICTAPPGDRLMANITTGVAIAGSDDDGVLTIYFGCIAQVAGHGGAGVLRMRAHKTYSRPTALGKKSKRIQAGNMFITDACDTGNRKREEGRWVMGGEPSFGERRDRNSSPAQANGISHCVLLMLVTFHIWKHAVNYSNRA